VLLWAFANGGSSLTGIEAVSNAVSALQRPEGRNARQILVIQGPSWRSSSPDLRMAHVTHATPYTKRRVPTVLAQEADLIFGRSARRECCSSPVQAGTAAILFTGGNTSFSGFPFLASFVAEDSFLPRWPDQARPPPGVLQRDHRADGGLAHAADRRRSRRQQPDPVLCDRGIHRFSMAGFGMAKYFVTHQASADAAISSSA
jgi:hypothetical protein